MLLYRSAAWFAKGLREYTKSGYESASKDFVPGDLEVQVPGRSFLVTGGNSGIGRATVIEIAKRGGTVHLVCRDQNRAEGARGEIIRESGNRNIFLHIVDLSDPKAIWKFVENFKQEHTLHVLINNAGCMVNKRELTEDGLEKNFATNTLGVYVLTTALIPVLEKEHDPRVITVSSGGMLVQKLNTNDLQSERTAFSGTMVYAQNKRQQVVLTEHWARAHPAIHFSCMHPGWADTPGVRLSMPGFHASMGDRLRSAAQGADTVLWLALAPAATAQPSGLFFQGDFLPGCEGAQDPPSPDHPPLHETRIGNQCPHTCLLLGHRPHRLKRRN
ncbi:dehydrogenase/reductase SDR family member 12 isoform X6 [Vicugna pacos]|uniref:Dehydrogenase/reductase SDR family member 12 isoform X6 n=1 Tax=Vicugna pacos TaxID=30538 RepID=A0A6J3B541_VICPA